MRERRAGELKALASRALAAPNRLAFWQILIATTSSLTLWGAFVGGGAWRVPCLALFAYLVMRLIVHMPYPQMELAAGMLWITIGMCMAYLGAYIPGILYATAGVVYPVFLLFGMRLSDWNSLAIATEIFALLALASMAVGLSGGRAVHSDGDCGATLAVVARYTLGAAKSRSPDT